MRYSIFKNEGADGVYLYVGRRMFHCIFDSIAEAETFWYDGCWGNGNQVLILPFNTVPNTAVRA